jgi:hypothetical protein
LPGRKTDAETESDAAAPGAWFQPDERIFMLIPSRIAWIVLLVAIACVAPLAAGEGVNGDMAGLESPDAMTMDAPALDISAEYEAAIRELMTLTGIDNIGEALKQNILQGIQRSMPDVGPETLQAIAADIDTTAVTNQMIATYARHLTQDEVETINAFLRTPAGRKYIETQPIIIQEGIQGTQQWAQQIYTKVIAKLQAQQSQEDDTMILPDAAPAGQQ